MIMGMFETYDSKESQYTPVLRAKDGEIKDYELDDKICYPNVWLKPFNAEDESYRGSVVQVLTSTLEKLQKTEREFKKLPDGYYFVYLEMDKDLLLGKIHSDNLKALLQGALYKDLEKCIRLSKGEKIEGVMMYSLCTSSQY